MILLPECVDRMQEATTQMDRREDLGHIAKAPDGSAGKPFAHSELEYLNKGGMNFHIWVNKTTYKCSSLCCGLSEPRYEAA